MASYAYLVYPEKQFMTKSGTINVAGTLRVYDAATDDPVITYKDFVGTENEEAIQLDNNGRAIVIADSDRVYRLEVYDRYNTLQWTTTPLWCQAGGGGASIARTDIVSSDGTVEITKTVVGSTTTFDLSTDVEDSTDLLEWIRCDGFVLHDNGCYVPEYTAGTMDIGNDGVNLYENRYYHVTGHIKAVKDNVVNQPFYDDVVVHFIGHNGEDEDVEFQTYKLDVDYSMAMPQVFEVSTDILAPSDIELLIKIDNAEISGATFSLEDLAIHRVFSGAPALPGGAASKEWVEGNFQEKLIPGIGITIDENNVISATAAQQKNADWDATSGVEEILNKPDLSVYATKEEVTEGLAGKQDTLIVGENITIVDNVISATAEPQRNSDWNANSGVEEILNKPDLSVYATKEEVAEDLSGKQDTLTPGDNITIVNNVISATAEPQVNADWDATSGVSEILNKPDLSIYAEKTDLDDYQPLLTPGEGIVIENNVISVDGGTFTQVNSDWEATSGVAEILHKPDLSVYATKEEVSEDLSGKQDTLTPGDNITIVNNVISATAAPQVNADWDATSGVEEILHKPDLSIYAEKSELATVATTGSYDDLLDKPTITQPVNADWNSDSGLSQILNKPDLSQYATQSDLADKQDVLTAGDNITIVNNVISATANAQVNSDWNATSGVAEILNKPTEKNLVAGSNITILEDNGDVVISASAEPQVNADWDATSGVAQILNKPTIPAAQVNADWEATEGVAEILNKPDEVQLVAGLNITIAESGNNLVISAAAEPQVNADWDATSGVAEILNKPNLAPVATSGSYNDLTDKPVQVNADWNATSGVAEILHKPTLSAVATSGSYNDLTDKLVAGENITIDENNVISASGGGTEQVNSDWLATSGVAEILNKPTEKSLVAGSNITILEDNGTVTISAAAAAQVNADWDATSGVAQILNKPTIPAAQVNADWEATEGISEILNKPDEVQLVAGLNITIAESGNTLVISAADEQQVNADWDATSGVAQILNKPSIPVIGTITLD